VAMLAASKVLEASETVEARQKACSAALKAF
jgi:hypothetical protein